MAIQSVAGVRFALGLSALLAVTGCSDKPLPIQIEKYCVSDSGLSRYWLSLNTAKRHGAIRYQYMGQDARYVVKAMQIESREVSGRADWQSSSTGETRGNPIVFTYNSGADTLKDGVTSATCQNRETNEQD